MRKFTLLLFLMSAFIGLNAQNLVLNGGFENWTAGVPDGWTKAELIEKDSVYVKDGTYSAKHEPGTTGTKDLSQMIAVTPGESYDISISYFVAAGDGSDARIWSNFVDTAGANMTDYAADLKGPDNGYFESDSSWQTYNVTVVAPATADSLYFEVRAYKNAIVYWDSLSVSVAEFKFDAAEITGFTFDNQIGTSIISTESAQVTSTVAWDADLSALVPTITVSEGAQVTATTLPVVFNGVDPVEYKVTAADGMTEKLWSVMVLQQAAPIAKTIYDIQFTEDASGDSPYVDSLVNTTGVVTGVVAKGFYMQDGKGAWNGIYVYLNAAPTAVVGDSVEVEGMVKEYYNLTELADAKVTITSSGNSIPDAEVVALADFTEAYEGVLAKVLDVACSVEANGYGEWEVSDGTNSIVLDDEMYTYAPVLAQTYASITGIGTYTFSAYKLLPRDAADIVTTGISREELAAVKMYPNPVNNQLTVENLDGVSQVMVSNILGQNLFVQNVTNVNMTINTSDLETGIYIVTFVTENGLTRSERIIKE